MPKKEVHRIVIQVFVTPAFSTEQKTRLQNKELVWPIVGDARISFPPDNNFVQFQGCIGQYSGDVEARILKGILEFTQSLDKLGLVFKQTKYEIYKVISSYQIPRDSSPKRK